MDGIRRPGAANACKVSHHMHVCRHLLAHCSLLLFFLSVYQVLAINIYPGKQLCQELAFECVIEKMPADADRVHQSQFSAQFACR